MEGKELRISFDGEAAQVLRRAGRLAGVGPVTAEALRAALATDDATPLPSTRLTLTVDAGRLVHHAEALATAAGTMDVARCHLRRAAQEELSLETGIPIKTLLTLRSAARTRYGATPARSDHISRRAGE